jgi:hypothetical protein
VGLPPVTGPGGPTQERNVIQKYPIEHSRSALRTPYFEWCRISREGQCE